MPGSKLMMLFVGVNVAILLCDLFL
jgi:hypothetical protein